MVDFYVEEGPDPQDVPNYALDYSVVSLFWWDRIQKLSSKTNLTTSKTDILTTMSNFTFRYHLILSFWNHHLSIADQYSKVNLHYMLIWYDYKPMLYLPNTLERQKKHFC